MATKRKAPARRKKSRMAAWAKRKAKAAAKKAWKAHRANAKKRKTSRKQTSSTRRQERQSTGSSRTGAFVARHERAASIWDLLVQKGHELLDKREVAAGVVSGAEWAERDKFASDDEWRRWVCEQRKQVYVDQRAMNHSGWRHPLGAEVRHGDPGAQPANVAPAFVSPQPRKPLPLPTHPVPRTQQPVFAPPPVRRRKRKRDEQAVVTAWKPQIVQIGKNAMAADSNLKRAAGDVLAFAEQFPETRSQVHEHAAAFAEFGAAFSSAMETFVATLRQGKGEGHPGMPPEVVDKLAPLTEVGETMRNAATSFSAAWEDYFAAAIKAAQDEHTPDKQALVS